jgi:hypothetical protein
MSYDPVDVGAGAVGFFFRRIPLLVLAVWGGSMAGAGGLAAGLLAGGNAPSIDLLRWAPVLLFSDWGMLNLPILLVAFIYFATSDGDGYVPWIWLVGVECLIVMLGHGWRLGGWLPWTAAVAACLVLVGMAATAAFFLRQWNADRWARHLAAVNAANAERLAARDAEQDAINRRMPQGVDPRCGRPPQR